MISVNTAIISFLFFTFLTVNEEQLFTLSPTQPYTCFTGLKTLFGSTIMDDDEKSNEFVQKVEHEDYSQQEKQQAKRVTHDFLEKSGTCEIRLRYSLSR
jgi:hypothetical protein